jgi:UDP-2,4-diacetamido-2,4,6-trideoxy-beta-L-altropyranose hydrolase
LSEGDGEDTSVQAEKTRLIDLRDAMRVLFLTEAAANIGGGHLMRCLTLAVELARGGADVRFAVNKDAPRFAPALERAGFAFTTVRALPDAAEIAARQGGVDTIVCDSYEFDAELERSLRTIAGKIVVIDDLADRPHKCDLLIDATFGRSAQDYRDLVSPETVILAGARYALLRPEFAALRGESLARRAAGGGVNRILVSLGLTDIGGITARVVAALLEAELKAQIDVVIGPRVQSRAVLEAIAARASRMELHIDPPNIARLMTNADIAIGAGGTTSWERCCLGLPTVLVVLADNQRLIGEKLGKAGAVRPIPDVTDAHLVEVTHTIIELSNDENARGKMVRAAATIIDGRGAGHATEAIYALMKQNTPADVRE